MNLNRRIETPRVHALFLVAVPLLSAGVCHTQIVVRDPVDLEAQDMADLRAALRQVRNVEPETIEVFAFDGGKHYLARAYLEPALLGYGVSHEVVECESWSLGTWTCRNGVPKVTVNFREQEIQVVGFEEPSEALFVMDSMGSRTFGCRRGRPVGATEVTAAIKLGDQRYQLSSQSNSLEVEWRTGRHRD